MRGFRVDLLQWVGLFGAAAAWTAQHVVGFGVTVADCGAGGSRWGIDRTTWEIALLAVGISLALVSEAAALSVLLETRGVEDSDPPPFGRRHFFALAAALGNLLFVVAMVLSGVAVLVYSCRQA
jgi:hypothetical protein